MTLKELVADTTWPSILASFSEINPEAENNVEEYGRVFKKLKVLEPESSDYWILLKSVSTEDEVYIDVSGLHKNPKAEEESYPQGLELTLWQEWLGMEIHPESLASFSATEIIVHCLLEMTFVGFSEEAIQKQIRSIEKNRKKRQSMTKEEQEEINASVEEWLKIRGES
ncbi:DUF6557 family protein [Arenibacter lacus]|uniref:DUF6557 family protein n=1 Tax=Arenibacter lacus TaxID=2608629 RepID=UPI00123DB28B|nr:DUF6557 family protein [Arenibacter lacus]